MLQSLNAARCHETDAKPGSRTAYEERGNRTSTVVRDRLPRARIITSIYIKEIFTSLRMS